MDSSTGPIEWRAPQPIVVSPGGIQGLSGAANATLLLGAGLIVVNLWGEVIAPLWQSAWNGKALQIAAPPGLALGEVVFVGVLVFVASVAPETASLTVWLVVALWVVWVINNVPSVVSALKYLSGAANATQAANTGATPDTTSGGEAVNTGATPDTTSAGGGSPALPTHNI